MRFVNIDKEFIAILDDTDVEIERIALNDPMLNTNLNAVIDEDPALQQVYNDLVYAARLRRITGYVRNMQADANALRNRLDVLAHNEAMASKDSTTAVLKARLHPRSRVTDHCAHVDAWVWHLGYIPF